MRWESMLIIQARKLMSKRFCDAQGARGRTLPCQTNLMLQMCGGGGGGGGGGGVSIRESSHEVTKTADRFLRTCALLSAKLLVGDPGESRGEKVRKGAVRCIDSLTVQGLEPVCNASSESRGP